MIEDRSTWRPVHGLKNQCSALSGPPCLVVHVPAIQNENTFYPQIYENILNIQQINFLNFGLSKIRISKRGLSNWWSPTDKVALLACLTKFLQHLNLPENVLFFVSWFYLGFIKLLIYAYKFIYPGKY